jgi:hypothetical protein
MIIDFCERTQIVINNTWFKKQKRRLYIWKAPSDQHRYQLVKQRFRNSAKDVQTQPGADIGSDHSLLVAKICTGLKRIIRLQKRNPVWDSEKWDAQREKVQGSLVEKLRAGDCVNRNVEAQWNNIKKCLLDTISDCVGKVEQRTRKPWIMQEMISKMDERRKWKSVNNEEGRETTEDWIMNWEEPQTKPRRNTLRANVTRLRNCKEEDGTI